MVCGALSLNRDHISKITLLIMKTEENVKDSKILHLDLKPLIFRACCFLVEKSMVGDSN